MKLHLLLLYFFEILTALCAMLILLSRNVLYAALALVCCLLCTAAMFLILHAEFIAISQVMIYAGGVIVLVIFGIMLTGRAGKKALHVGNQNAAGGMLIALLMMGILVYCYQSASVTLAANAPATSTHISSIALALLTTYAFPFEIAGLLLLVSLIAAAVSSAGYLSKKNNNGG